MNNTLIISAFSTIIVGFLATIGTVLGAWLSNNAKFKEIIGDNNTKYREFEGSFKVVESKLSNIENRLSRIENKVDSLDERVRQLELFNASNISSKILSK